MDVAVENVPPVRALMRGDPLRSRAFANPRDRDRVRLRVFRFRHRRIPRLPQRRYMIDINPKPKSARHAGNRMQPLAAGKFFSFVLVNADRRIRVPICLMKGRFPRDLLLIIVVPFLTWGIGFCLPALLMPTHVHHGLAVAVAITIATVVGLSAVGIVWRRRIRKPFSPV
jgi:hypothetical protein